MLSYLWELLNKTEAEVTALDSLLVFAMCMVVVLVAAFVHALIITLLEESRKRTRKP